MIRRLVLAVALSLPLLLIPATRPPMGRAAEDPSWSVARQWNEALLNGIRRDLARPTVHSRNLFHTSVAMWDAWAAYDDVASTFLLGKTVRGFTVPFAGVPEPVDVKAAREEAISYACYRLLSHRFGNEEFLPRSGEILADFDALFQKLGYDPMMTDTDYTTGVPAALGNYIADRIIAFGLQDGSNEQNNYANRYYTPVNQPLIPLLEGNPTLTDFNRWQPLTLDVFIDQSGNVFPRSTPSFVGAEWGGVVPFSLTEHDLTMQHRDGYDYWVYHDPGPPAYMDEPAAANAEEYRWAHELVAVWSNQLDPHDGVMWDISPASIGNIDFEDLPRTVAEYHDFYDLENGGDPGTGRNLNPVTGLPYEPQIVPRGDYTRVLAEFWADGPNSETPPGHWFTILNYVSDHPLFEKRFEGEGPVLDDLEWDVKAYLTLGGTVHDAAITAWGIKGWYDYIRPISAIRAMCDRGQSSDPLGPQYNPMGITLIPGICELVEEGDPLAGLNNRNVGKIKLNAWRAHAYIDDPESDEAGVGWILAGFWWPYQRPTFVTPPFAGYISGHSCFSRAAAVVMAGLTGSDFFPGGMGTFYCPQNDFLVFEEGPSQDLTLQWATYRDASDQCSLSRIWGGIHPPVDDMPGRIIGEGLGLEAFNYAKTYFNGEQPLKPGPSPILSLSPNPVALGRSLSIQFDRPTTRIDLYMYDIQGRLVHEESQSVGQNQQTILVDLASADMADLSSGMYYVRTVGDAWQSSRSVCILK